MDRLICFPHAGGSANAYMWLENEFKKSGKKDMEIMIYEYPGHGRRRNEAYFHNYQEAVRTIASELREKTGANSGKFYLMGHSMGTYIALGVAEFMSENYKMIPEAVFVSGQSSPMHVLKEYGKLDNDMLLEYLKSLGGMDDEILENPKYQDFFLAPVRADMHVLDTYTYSGNKCQCRLYVAYGDCDPEIEEERLSEWKLAAKNPDVITKFHGGHFFLLETPQLYVEYLMKRM